ncbi:hypothetical protein OBBRIDRAFT_891123 [Obba rivulosa]|uniref:Uncharacterized protein n=1 Tax=Obba rivulosa TaxID=1052685 RepID=A0A8E2DH66_9APHY|nr:hypothetical protein OBBRIDRAFT_891123 [Obba rivulosa]
MANSRRLDSVLLTALAAILFTNVVIKLATFAWIQAPSTPAPSGSWTTHSPPVLLLSNNQHVGPYWSDSAEEWAALVPGNGTVHVGARREPFRVSMFHQLQCLDTIRRQLVLPKPRRNMQRARHCMNYLRQMALCRGDTFLDPYEYLSKVRPLARHAERRCLDWRVLYDAAEKNHHGSPDWLEGFTI